MVNETTYRLTEKNYIKKESEKTQIILGSTLNHNMRHVHGWSTRLNGNNKKTAAFSIDAAGVVYKHFDPKYYSEYFEDSIQNVKSIIILLDNDGYLEKVNENNEFITWLGDIYKDSEDIYQKKWRNYRYWSPYTEEQFNSSIELVKSLSEEFKIEMNVVGHNTKIDTLKSYEGVLYKSNFDKKYIDLNPSWDFVKFKNKLE